MDHLTVAWGRPGRNLAEGKCFSLGINYGLRRADVNGTEVTLPDMAVCNKRHRYGNSHAVRDHTVLPATRQMLHSRLCPSQGPYSI